MAAPRNIGEHNVFTGSRSDRFPCGMLVDTRIYLGHRNGADFCSPPSPVSPSVCLSVSAYLSLYVCLFVCPSASICPLNLSPQPVPLSFPLPSLFYSSHPFLELRTFSVPKYLSTFSDLITPLHSERPLTTDLPY